MRTVFVSARVGPLKADNSGATDNGVTDASASWEAFIDAIEAAYGPQDALRLPQVKFVQPLLPEEEAAIVLEDMRLDGAPRWRFRVERAGVLLASGDVVADGPAQA